MCLTEFEERVGLMNVAGAKSTAYDVVLAFAKKKIGKFTSADTIAACPSAGRSSILYALKRLTAEGIIMKCGTGKNTFYVRKDAFEE